jgi:hypothetical protein
MLYIIIIIIIIKFWLKELLITHFQVTILNVHAAAVFVKLSADISERLPERNSVNPDDGGSTLL